MARLNFLQLPQLRLSNLSMYDRAAQQEMTLLKACAPSMHKLQLGGVMRISIKHGRDVFSGIVSWCMLSTHRQPISV